MLLGLLILLTIVPLVELSILFRLADRFHWGPTLALVVITGCLGAALARREGLRVVQRIRTDLEAGKPPEDAMVDGLLILVAGVLLVTPGVLTDFVGFSLLVPSARRWIKRRLSAMFHSRIVMMHDGVFQHDSDPHEDFVDVAGTSRDAERPDHGRLER